MPCKLCNGLPEMAYHGTITVQFVAAHLTMVNGTSRSITALACSLQHAPLAPHLVHTKATSTLNPPAPAAFVCCFAEGAPPFTHSHTSVSLAALAPHGQGAPT